jgi:hypothetical protein
MAKTYNFGEKKTEYNAKLGKECDVWQTPKYIEAKKKAIEAIESDTFKGVLSEADFWILMNATKSGKMAYTGLIISHNGCLKINDVLPEDKRFKPSCMALDKDGYNGSLVYSYSNDAQGIYEVGEVSAKNCSNAYPYAMALKRCMDRVILKSCKLAYSGIYSDSEAEEFKNEPKEESAPVKPSKAPAKAPAADTTGAEMQRLLVELCKAHGLNLNDICKQYKINRNSNSEDIAAAYYDLNNKIMRGEL